MKEIELLDEDLCDKTGCEYANGVDMPEYSCSGDCQWRKYAIFVNSQSAHIVEDENK